MWNSKLTSALCVLLMLFIQTCTSHGHNHDHHGHSHDHDEPPSFKYSKAANERVHSEQHTHHSEAKEKTPIRTPLSSQELWLHAMGSTLLISAAPFFILFFVPLDNTDTEQPLLKILLAFASGGLLGDAFLHLIPHATMALEETPETPSHSHTHSHAHAEDEHGHAHDMSVGLWVLAGIVVFLVVEKVVRIVKGNHAHSHSDAKVAEQKTLIKKKKDQGDGKENSKDEEKKETPEKEIKVAGYLNLAADFSHNFTDGLAIGSSYLAGNTIGIYFC